MNSLFERQNFQTTMIRKIHKLYFFGYFLQKRILQNFVPKKIDGQMSCDLMRNFLDFFVIVEKNVSENGESIKNNPNWDI